MNARWRHAFPPSATGWRRWVTVPGSLTRQLQRIGAFSVEPVVQARLAVAVDERRALGVRRRGRLPVREVLLCCDGVPVVFARTVVASAAIAADWPFWFGLGRRSLGLALFADRRVKRGGFAYRRTRSRELLDRRIARALDLRSSSGNAFPRSHHARRSVFSRNRGKMLVTEVFLPALRAQALYPDVDR